MTLALPALAAPLVLGPGLRDLRALRTYGWGAKYHCAMEGGMNSRMDELQAELVADELVGDKRALLDRFASPAAPRAGCIRAATARFAGADAS